MKRYAVTVILLLVAAGVCWWAWHTRQSPRTPRQDAAVSLRELLGALASPDTPRLLQSVAMPEAVRDRTPSEQAEFLRKALVDEVSAEGIRVLENEGQFGPLLQVFPTEGPRWAELAGVSPSNCIAFRLERNGIVAEVAIATNTVPPRIVRCNNVKQIGNQAGG